MSPVPRIPNLERPAFFAGQRLTADDLAAVQRELRELRWLHNRSLHGWGIVFGCQVAGARGDRMVLVRPGFALDALGRELILHQPLTLAIPSVSGGSARAQYYLTLSYIEDPSLVPVAGSADGEAEPAVEMRAGPCGATGAVRLPDLPRLRWQDVSETDPAGRYRPGEDVILATIQIQNCRLVAPPATNDRRQFDAATQPAIAASQTLIGQTRWELWSEGGATVGFQTEVDTSTAHFSWTPVYTARVGGSRVRTGSSAAMGLFTAVSDATPDRFMLRAWLQPSHDPSTNVPLSQQGLAEIAATLRWHVIWMGVGS